MLATSSLYLRPSDFLESDVMISVDETDETDETGENDEQGRDIETD